jgi:SAM-dependent methyltransferase
MKKTTSWQSAHRWYHENVGQEGLYYHQHIILPKLLDKIKGAPIVDMGCGQGVLGRKIDPGTPYEGYDISPALVRLARKQDPSPLHYYHVHDCMRPISSKTLFKEGVCLLAAQNMESLPALFATTKQILKPGGTFHLVLNHPCFRIPRQSSWEVDESKKIQYRRIDRYLSPLKIPIQVNPGKGSHSPETWSFHFSLSDLIKAAQAAGFCLFDLEEWISDKKSTGSKAKMENRAREEIPLFLYVGLRSGGV